VNKKRKRVERVHLLGKASNIKGIAKGELFSYKSEQYPTLPLEKKKNKKRRYR